MVNDRAKGLIVLDSNTYISYNPRMVSLLKKVLITGNYPQSEVFAVLRKYGITTKSELREIRQGLKNLNQKD
ncbi:MAG: hypothetical protein GF364_13365 [Candidatus Lokiarchaeota archaeon]|nr:hypothetical protein [Candidatus Lokiarchaeota archaeon]